MKQWMNKPAIMIIGILVALTAAGIGGWLVMNEKHTSRAESGLPYSGHGGTFKNTLAEMDTPDPSIVYRDGYYYMTFTHNGADIMVMRSRTLDFYQAERKVVWYPPVDTMYSANLWAPELQYLQGRWYIYFAADDGQNENHRMYVLQADTDDPLGSYTFKGKVSDQSDKWAIDGLVLELDEQLYFIWSGWEGDVNIAQNTYIAPMSNPWTISGPRVLISEPEYEWEKAGGPPYINEGQAILQRDGRVFLAYSGAGSWTPFYSIGMLMLEAGADPLIPDNWRKFEQPFMQMDQEAGVYGPGHNTFVKSPDGSEDWIVYHATSGLHDGWNNRKARAQKIAWDEDGFPVLGSPLPLDTAIEVPSGNGVFLAEHAKVTDSGGLAFDLIPASTETSAPMLIHYKHEGDAVAAATLSVNGEEAGTVTLQPTGQGGDVIGYAYALMPLQAGMNAVAIDSLPSGVQIEAIEIPRVEAEFAQTSGNSEALTNPFASGRGVVQLAGKELDSLRFANIRVPAEGEYTLTFAIANPNDATEAVEVVVNGSERHRLEVAATGRNTFTPVQVKVQLHAGKNQLVLEQATDRLDVDYLDITRDTSDSGTGGRDSLSSTSAANVAVNVGEAIIDAGADHSASASPSASRIRLEYWTPFSGGDNQFMTEMVERFNHEQTDVYVVQVNSRLDDYYSRLRTAILSGDAPDVSIIHTTNLPQFVQNGYIEDITSLAEDAGIDWQVFNPNILESAVYDGRAYAVPLDTHALVMYYNKQYLDMAGVLDDSGRPVIGEGAHGFVDFLQNIKDAVPAGVAPMAQPSTRIDSVWLWWSLYNQMKDGGKFYEADGQTPAIDNDNALEALTYIYELYESGLIPPNINDAFKLFYDGEAAVLITGMWGTGAFEANASLDFGAVQMPVLYDHPAVWGDSHTIAIPTNLEMTDEKRRAALTFASWLVDHGEMWAKAGHVPSNKHALQREEFRSLQFRSDYEDTANHVAYWPRHAKQWSVVEILIREFERMIYGQLTPEETLQSAQAKIKEEIAK